MHLKRWITGLIVLPFVIFIIYRGGIIFFLLIAVGNILALWEYFRIVLKEQKKIISAFPLTAMIAGLVMIWTVHTGKGELAIGVLAVNLMVAALIAITRFGVEPAALETLKKQILGVIYIPLFLSCLILIRNSDNGMYWIFLLLSIVFAGDTGAFYVGTFLGRRKLAPAVSPGKTIEGSIGGLATGVAVGSLAKAIFLPDLPWPTSTLLCLVTGIAAQIGDLFESALKRASNVKDSGNLLPGHGGILDRIDALLFAGPVVYLFIVYIL